ncbi:hypothetical protein BG011_009602 [Mortierella polycephala]|uniref:Ion transport domain-containing protein n=1 Tax=Mortierella polycephala TaxID=41804 RepID=A0A9P6PMM4_9FUNG|nr:hypothetical protein BG011_009602 [Mortierella polycephala]
MFFVISAGGIIAFSIAILHLLRSCPFERCKFKGEFPSHFYGAFTTTFLFMGGRYDSIEDELDSTNYAFQTMMVVFFFFAVILMLNVLIALINKAFKDGDDTWRQTWLENRLRVIENVENLSFDIPGFRAHFNYFPDEIYYSATVKEVDDFKAKYPNDFINSDLANDKSQPVARDAPDATAITTCEKPLCEVKEELKQSREQVLKLQEQMQEQNTTLESKVSVLQEQNNALWKQNASIQGRMEDLHGMLSTLLRVKADSDSS